MKKRIGGGAFGDVFLGTWKKANETVEVAVKRLKGHITKKERVIFLKVRFHKIWEKHFFFMAYNFFTLRVI